jgi:hypothetical protein
MRRVTLCDQGTCARKDGPLAEQLAWLLNRALCFRDLLLDQFERRPYGAVTKERLGSMRFQLAHP